MSTITLTSTEELAHTVAPIDQVINKTIDSYDKELRDISLKVSITRLLKDLSLITTA